MIFRTHSQKYILLSILCAWEIDENEKGFKCYIVTNKELFKSDLPIPDGVYDAHMGTTDHLWICETCGNHKG